MILDNLSNLQYYTCLNPGFETVRQFISSTDLGILPTGKHIIDGDRVFANVVTGQGKGRAAVQLEAHDVYIDIQCILQGPDIIGWRCRQSCKSIAIPYDQERDLLFYKERPTSWITCPAGSFALLMPSDAHAPMAAADLVRKIIFKVKA
jgi:biofilm protein TabA